jgi:hypothetical protein
MVTYIIKTISQIISPSSRALGKALVAQLITSLAVSL